MYNRLINSCFKPYISLLKCSYQIIYILTYTSAYTYVPKLCTCTWLFTKLYECLLVCYKLKPTYKLCYKTYIYSNICIPAHTYTHMYMYV